MPISRADNELQTLIKYAHNNQDSLRNLLTHIVSKEPAVMTTEAAEITAAKEILSQPIPTVESVCRQLSRPRVGVGCIVISQTHPGCILVGERIGSHGSGRWALPGGHLEPSQSWGECASMELEEECGIDMASSVWQFISVTNDVMVEEGLHYITIFVAATVSDAGLAKLENREPDKCAGWSWMTIDELRTKAIFIPLKHLLEDPAAVKFITQASRGSL